MRGLLIGRFQPFHQGHLAVVRELRSKRPEEAIILGIGSAQESYTWKNPFTAGERFEMIERALHEAGAIGWLAVPIVDIERHSIWVSHVETFLPSFDRIYTNNPLTRLLFERAGYPVEAPTWIERARYEGEKIRCAIVDDAEWPTLVPPAVHAYLNEIRAVDRLKLLSERNGSSARD